MQLSDNRIREHSGRLLCLFVVAVCFGISTTLASPASQGQQPPPAKALVELTATEISPRLKSGEVSVVTYVNALLETTSRHSDSLNAFITMNPEEVLSAAHAADAKRIRGDALGPLFGIPISLKDLIVTKDLVTTFGTQKFRDFVPTRNAPLVERLLAADAIIFGKNNAQEWAYGSNGYNSHYGQQLNPFDETRIAGGSTGGGAAAVAARMLPIAIGSDTAASIRVPAAFTGLYGLRPTTGRYDNSGVAPIAPTLDTIGPLTRSVTDMVLIDSVLSDDWNPLPETKLKGLRIGVPSQYFHAGVSSEMMQSFNSLLATLRSAGVVLIEANLPDAQQLTDAGLYPILFYETYPAVSTFLSEWTNDASIEALHAELGWDTKAVWDQLVMPGAPEAIPEETYKAAINQIRPQLQSRYDSYFEQQDVVAIIFPATAGTAPLAKPDNPLETIIDDESVSIFIHDHNSSPGALAGQPGIVMPLSLGATGLPLAVSLDGKRGGDRDLLSVGAAIAAIITPLPSPYGTTISPF